MYEHLHHMMKLVCLMKINITIVWEYEIILKTEFKKNKVMFIHNSIINLHKLTVGSRYS